jgi:hypothetical protein
MAFKYTRIIFILIGIVMLEEGGTLVSPEECLITRITLNCITYHPLINS